MVAHAIASTGRNLRGDFMPLFVNLADPLGEPPQPWGDTWYQPFLFYLTALALKFLPFTAAAVRAPAALLGGLVSPLLLYAVARRLGRDRLEAMVAAMVLALAPPMLILSRQALDYICPLPFVLAWLWCLIAFVQTGRIVFAAAGGLILGVGCYTYIASWMLMPIYLALSWLVFHRAGHGFAKPTMAATIGFALPVAVLIPWLWLHPEMLRETVARYTESEQAARPLMPEGDTPVGVSIATVMGTYASFFDPEMLFVRGGPSMTTTTSRSGVFMLPVVIFLPAGLYALWRQRDPAGLHWLLIAGVLTAPIPAAIKGEAYMIQRALYMLPFAALVSAMGFGLMWRARPRVVRAAALLLLLAGPLQFGAFYSDYFTQYKYRSAFYYDPVAFRDVARRLLDEPTVPAFYFSADLDDAGAKWRFYAIEFNRQDVLHRTRHVPLDGPELASAPSGSLLVLYVAAGPLAALQAGRQWEVVQVIKDVDGREAAAILRRSP